MLLSFSSCLQWCQSPESHSASNEIYAIYGGIGKRQGLSTANWHRRQVNGGAVIKIAVFGGETGSPVWENSGAPGSITGKITGLDLNRLTANGQSFQFDFTIMTNAGSWSVYEMNVTRTNATTFPISGLTLTGSSPTTAKTHNNLHGQDAADSDFRRSDIWQNDAPPGEPNTWPSGLPGTIHGMGFDPTVWDFSTVDWLKQVRNKEH